MQEPVEVSGIILSAMPVGEADRRLLLLTKELGKISCFARGARKPTSALVGATRPFSFGRFSLYPGKDSYTLSKADIREYFEDLVLSVEGSAYGCYLMELIGVFTRENAPAEGELTLLYYGLKALTKNLVPKSLVRRIFELRLLHMNGVAPDFHTCPACKKPLVEGGFRPSRMQAFCRTCEPELPDPLGKSAVYALQYIEDMPPAKLFSFRVNDVTEEEMGRVIDCLLAAEVDRPLASKEMLSVLLR